MARTPTRFVPAEDSVDVVQEVARDSLAETAEALIAPVQAAVPYRTGGMLRNYEMEVEELVWEGGRPQARLWTHSGFWHWLEYGNRWNPPYRPMQTGITRAGVRYVPS